MRLKEGFVTHRTNEDQIMVGTGDVTFSGLVRSNHTAAFIVDALKEETTKEAIVESMCAIYDAPAEVIEKDVEKILNQLRSIGALVE